MSCSPSDVSSDATSRTVRRYEILRDLQCHFSNLQFLYLLLIELQYQLVICFIESLDCLRRMMIVGSSSQSLWRGENKEESSTEIKSAKMKLISLEELDDDSVF